MGGGNQRDERRVDALMRVGLTQSEARRLERSERFAAHTRPWREANPFGLMLWAVWKLLHHGFRPAWFLLSVAAAVAAFAWSVHLRGVDALLEPGPPPLETRIEAAFLAATPPGEDVRGHALARMREALGWSAPGEADLIAFRAWASALPRLIGEDRIALEQIGGGADEAALSRAEASLAAMAVARREALLAEARAQGLARLRADHPAMPGLSLADPAMLRRYCFASRWNDVLDGAAEDFLRGRSGGGFDLARAPSLGVPQSSAFYDDERALIAAACLRAAPQLCSEEMRLAAGGELDLALAAAGAGRGGDPAAILLRAASATGRLDPQLAQLYLAQSDPDGLSRRLVEALGDVEAAFAAPDAYQGVIDASLVDTRRRQDAAGLGADLDAMLAVRDASSALIAVRLSDVLRQPGDAVRLRRLVEALGTDVIVLHQVYGADMLALTELAPAPEPVDLELWYYLSAAAGLSALIALLAALRDLARKPLHRQARWWRGADIALTRLLLGKKT